jgi:hypothetical protein
MEEKSIISGRRKSGRHLNDTSGKSTDDATCKICLQIFRSPFVTLCGHTFCRECITNHLSHNSKCPECDSDLEHKRFRLIPNYTAAAIVQQKQRERNSLKRTAAVQHRLIRSGDILLRWLDWARWTSTEKPSTTCS